jgi:hypothetical protein
MSTWASPKKKVKGSLSRRALCFFLTNIDCERKQEYEHDKSEHFEEEHWMVDVVVQWQPRKLELLK